MRHWKTWIGTAAAAALLAAGPALAEQTFEPGGPMGGDPSHPMDVPEDDTQNRPADDTRNQPGADARSDAQAASEEEYVVEQGDTLAEIAEEKLGSAAEWKVLAQANGIDDPAKLRVGQKLRIPSDRRS